MPIIGLGQSGKPLVCNYNLFLLFISSLIVTKYNYKIMVKGYKSTTPSLDSDRTPPWVRNKFNHMHDARLNWSFMDDIEMLCFCTPESIQASYDTLTHYFVRSYNYDPNVVETLLSFAINRDYSVLETSYQLDQIIFTDETTKNIKTDRKRFSIEFGKLTTKQDLIWYIKNNWDTEIKPTLSSAQPPIKRRTERGASFRDSLIYLQHSAGATAKKIQANLDNIYLEDPNLDLSTISNTKNRFEPNDDWFATPRAMFKKDNPFKDFPDRFTLKYSDKPKPHFIFQKI